MKNAFKRMIIALGAWYLRHTPFVWGRYRITAILLPWLRQLRSTLGTKFIWTRYHFRFQADLGDWLGQRVYLTGIYEPPTTVLFTHLIQPGDTILDIGANVGYFSLLYARLTGAQGQVIAFEPIPSVRGILEQNIKLNDFKQIEIIPKAVSNQSTTLTIYEGPEDHKGTSSLRALDSASRSLSIESIAIDDLLILIDKVNLIKIDVEGAEMQALLGMERLVERDHPNFVIEFTEAYLESFGHSVGQMAEWLFVRGYKLYRIEDVGLIPLRLSEFDGLPDQYNVLACQNLPAGLVERRLWP